MKAPVLVLVPVLPLLGLAGGAAADTPTPRSAPEEGRAATATAPPQLPPTPVDESLGTGENLIVGGTLASEGDFPK